VEVGLPSSMVVTSAHDDIRILYDFKFYVLRIEPHSTSADVCLMFVTFLPRTIRYL